MTEISQWLSSRPSRPEKQVQASYVLLIVRHLAFILFASVTVIVCVLHQRWSPSNQLISQRRSCCGSSNTPAWFRNSSLMIRTSERSSTSCSSATNRWITSSWCCRYPPSSFRHFQDLSEVTDDTVMCTWQIFQLIFSHDVTVFLSSDSSGSSRGGVW